MRREAIRGVLWLLPGRAVQVVAHFGGIFVLARYFLDREAFGIAGLALAVTGLFAVAADWGMGVLAVQRREIDDRRAASIAEGAGFASMLAVALGAPWFARLLGDPAGLVPLMRAGAAALIFAGFASTARARLARDLSFRALAMLDATIALVSAGGRIGFAMAGYGAWSIVLGDLVAGGVGAAALWLLAPPMRTGREQPLAADGGRVVGARAADGLFERADRFLIGRGIGTGALGLYGFSWQHAMVFVQQLTPVVEQIALPVFSRVQHDKPALARAYEALTRIFALLVIPAAGLLWLLAPWLVEVLYPARWQASAPVIRALCTTAAAAGVNSHPGLVWLALGDTCLRMRWSIVNLGTLIGVIALGLPYGVTGVAYALAGRSLLAAVAAQIITRRKVGLSHRVYCRALLPGLAVGSCFWLLAWI